MAGYQNPHRNHRGRNMASAGLLSRGTRPCGARTQGEPHPQDERWPRFQTDAYFENGMP
jgi:hypothetical protein